MVGSSTVSAASPGPNAEPTNGSRSIVSAPAASVTTEAETHRDLDLSLTMTTT